MGRKFVVPTEFRGIDKLTRVLGKMGSSVKSFANSAYAQMARVDRAFSRIGSTALQWGKQAAFAGALITAPLVVAAKDAVEFEDKLADVGKTTGLQGKNLEGLGNDLLELSSKTRTSADDLLAIAEIGGQLGVPKSELNAFTESVNKFNVALGADFTGGVEEASSAIGKIKNLFETTRKVPIADAIIKTGSAINELGAVGAGTSANIADFTQRMGALPDALKPSITDVLALGTYLEEMGIDSQIASGGLSNFLLVAGKDIGAFAKQMKISASQAKQLLAEDPSEFAKKFAASLNGLSPDRLARVLHDLKIGSQESIKVLGALGSDIKRVGELENIAADAFAKGTSLQDEYNRKNETTAAKVAMARNNLNMLSITLGNALIPVLDQLVKSLMPMAQQFIAWAQKNPDIIAGVAKLAVSAAGLAFAISGISFAVAAFSKVMYIGKAAMAVYNIVLGVSAGLTGVYSIAIGQSTLAQNAAKVATFASTAAQWLWNAALTANPIGLVIVAIVAMGVAVYGLSRALSGQTMAQELSNETMERAKSATFDQRFELNKLFASLRDTVVGSDEYNATLERLEELQPGVIEKYKLQAGALADINRAEKELIKNILTRAKVEAGMEQLKESLKYSEELKAEGPNFLNRVVNDLGMDSGFDDALAEEEAKQELLVKQIAADQRSVINPERERQNSTRTVEKNQNISFEFNNLPEWLRPVVNGKPVSNTPMPVLGSTR